MAISFVIDPSISPCFSFSSSSSSSRTLPLRNLHFHGRPSPVSPLISKPNRRFPIFFAHQTNSEEANSKQQADVKTLIRSYKQALFNGDETSVAEIETMFCQIEKEKNKMDQKVLSLSMKIASEKETKIRLQADFDNTRKKLDKDRLSTESNAKVQIMKSLLPIIDSFERAKLQVRVDTEKEKKIDTSYQGIYRQFVEVLRHLRVSAVATVGKPFDPLLHEAISREESEVVKAGIITEELNRGFVLGHRVLRPAKVKVSLGPVKKKTPSPAEEITPSL
ncbi:GrpE nucleotide exchange factor [Arabidopsis thaliana x Arabidopsis arenosa]|uniref:GrpE nucleotide exchange factor n=1 Tax=Arabidopsis thaliana x Arabidopsis arenosa TaxID=1240361 RepID=A0A8T2C7K4_9BRAS|nr:GrpE nucleotide exchange factor [Arabidopsis thaliana x Arabidopsis arenosa]